MQKMTSRVDTCPWAASPGLWSRGPQTWAWKSPVELLMMTPSECPLRSPGWHSKSHILNQFLGGVDACCWSRSHILETTVLTSCCWPHLPSPSGRDWPPPPNPMMPGGILDLLPTSWVTPCKSLKSLVLNLFVGKMGQQCPLQGASVRTEGEDAQKVLAQGLNVIRIKKKNSFYKGNVQPWLTVFWLLYYYFRFKKIIILDMQNSCKNST